MMVSLQLHLSKKRNSYNTEFVAIPTYAGILLADISLHKSVQSLTSTPTSASRIISTILFTSGAYLISVPNVHMEWSPFFKFITAPGALFGSIFYPDGGTVYHLTNYMGLFLVFAGIVLSQSLQRFFAFQAFVRLGQLSLPIYLLHGPILRTLGATLLYYGTTPGMPVSVFREFFAMGVFAATTLFMAKRWEERVEPWCAKITMILDDLVTGKVAATVRVTERAPASATV
jgi:peptidoglycan/LPS O-acetylase OafA/YrhL